MIQPCSRPPAFINVSKDLEAALIEIGGALPAWDMAGSFLADATLKRYQAQMESVPLVKETAATLRQALTGEGGGYAVLRLGNLAKALGTDDDRFLRLATAFAAEVAVPFSPFPRWPLWKDIGVKVDKDPGKSSGIGYNAFHMDLVNATQPPDYTTLLCVRPDPLGGGPSILSDAHAAVARLSEDCRALLAESAYHYGTFFDLHGVGEEYKPFPILDGSDPDGEFVRFTAKMLVRSELGQAHAEAARELAEELVRGQVSFMLRPGDYLIVNQRRFFHGREALHSGQETIPVADRRLLLQMFLRAPAGTGSAAQPGDGTGVRG
ncbi:TauD/TfdA family dioxygenase [Nonomuraea sp. MG754425]|uniref:TauD/TfdA family dioxygenase n=1 Tax=Nonomuraea sp. MG754425 TaxID=2570319 RepID=UPI001F33E7CA|nr:TauD/TfdA family dioxygenase [Nonomuraea sp. MG754425]MCF6475159.1 TauD/TfdA family dioxygenase [Nonomuraea sp. MG754425]